MRKSNRPTQASRGKLLTLTGDVPGGNRTYTYDSAGRVRTMTDSEGYTLTYDYDNLDRVRVVTYPDASFEQFEYADHSLIATRDRAGRWTRHKYNALRERVLTRDASGRTTQYGWCRCGEMKRLLDGSGNSTEWTRDARGRVTRKTYADGSHYDYEYDFSGRLRREFDAMARSKTFEYSLDDRLLFLNYSDAATADVTYAYDPWFPRLTSRVDGVGTTSYVYHPVDGTTLGAGQLARVNGPFPDDTLKYTYDELGRLKKTQIVDDATFTTASYSDEATFDTRGRVSAVTNNLGAFSYAYMGQSNRVDFVNYPNGMKVDYSYYGATTDFLLSQIKNLSAAVPPTVISQFDYTYNPDRTIATWAQLQNGVTTTWTFGYDPIQQLTSAVRRNSGGTVIRDERYGYDGAGNRIQVTEDGVARNAQVNNLNQLTSERGYGKTKFTGTLNEPATVTVNGQPAVVKSADGGVPYTFEADVDLASGGNTVTVVATDGNGNVRTNQYSVPTTGVAQNYEYDLNGNTRFEKTAAGVVVREFQWDQENRMVKIIAGTQESQFTYDGESKRVRIRELDGGAETSNQTFVWCGIKPCQKRGSTGGTVVRSLKRSVAVSLALAFFALVACTEAGPALDAGDDGLPFPVRRTPGRVPGGSDVLLVSVVVLLTRPEVFHAKRVQVEGWLDPTFEGVALYLSRDAAIQGACEYGVALSGVSRTSLQSFSRGDFVRVEGLYRSGDSGHENLWPGGISVTRLDPAL